MTRPPLTGLGPHDPVDLSAFGRDPWWLILAKAIAIFAFLVLTVLAAILIERKVMGRMQHRPGPNRLGPFGILQSLAPAVAALAGWALLSEVLGVGDWIALACVVTASAGATLSANRRRTQAGPLVAGGT